MTNETTYAFACGDVMDGCPRDFHGAQADILEAVAAHAAADHGITEVTPELVETVVSRLQVVAAV